MLQNAPNCTIQKKKFRGSIYAPEPPYPRNITSATCLRRLPYIWRHLRQRNSVNKTEAYHIRQYASRFLTTFWYHIF